MTDIDVELDKAKEEYLTTLEALDALHRQEEKKAWAKYVKAKEALGKS